MKNMTLKQPISTRIFILLFSIWAAMISPYAQAAISTDPTFPGDFTPIPVHEMQALVNYLNSFKRERRKCGKHSTLPATRSNTLAKDDNAIAAAQKLAKDLGVDDRQNLNFKEVLDQQIQEAHVGYIATTTIPLRATSLYDRHAVNVVSTLVEGRNSLCAAIMKIANPSSGGVGMGKYVRETAAGKRFYWWIIVFNKGILGPPVPDSGLSTSKPTVLSQNPVISTNNVNNNRFMHSQKPLHTLKKMMNNTNDLVITQFKTIGSVKKVDQNTHEQWVRVAVLNQGEDRAGIFRIGIWANDTATEMRLPFSVQGQADFWMPSTSSALNPGESSLIEGTITFNPVQTGQSIDLYAVADDCRDDLARSDGDCDVDESNEDNNESRPIQVNNPHRTQVKFTAPAQLIQP